MSKGVLKPKFTKGPWEVFPKESTTKVYCDDTYGSMVADCRPSQYCMLVKSETEANARLIAAAPEMFELLRAGLEDGDPMNWDKVSDLLYSITGQK